MVQKVDIAPVFRKMISLMPAEELKRMQQCFEGAEEKGTMIALMILDIDKEILKRNLTAKSTTECVKMKIDDIKIFPCFEERPPKAEKYEIKSWQYARSGMEEFDIVLDPQNYLIDGYCGYLLALEHGLSHIPIRYGKRQIVRAYHKQGGKLYVWELPGLLVDRVSIGDKVLVHTQRGIRAVTVAAVEEYRPEEYPEPLRKVFRRKKKVRAA